MRGCGYEIMGIYRGNGVLYVPRVWVSGVICGVKDADTIRMWMKMEMLIPILCWLWYVGTYVLQYVCMTNNARQRRPRSLIEE
jgi:hypothetical protein